MHLHIDQYPYQTGHFFNLLKKQSYFLSAAKKPEKCAQYSAPMIVFRQNLSLKP